MGKLPGTIPATTPSQSSTSLADKATPRSNAPSPEDCPAIRGLIESPERTADLKSSHGLPIFFPLSAERSTTMASGSLERLSGCQSPPSTPMSDLQKKPSMESIQPMPTSAEDQRDSQQREPPVTRKIVDKVNAIVVHQGKMDELQLSAPATPPSKLDTSSTTSFSAGCLLNTLDKLSTYAKHASHVHNTWDAIQIHTAKCDSCNKRNSSVLQRCQKCNMQWCEECLLDSSDGVHTTDGALVNWTPSNRKQGGVLPTRKSTRISAKSTSTRAPSKAGDDSSSRKTKTHLGDLLYVRGADNLRVRQGLEETDETDDDDLLLYHRKEAKAAMLYRDGARKEERGRRVHLHDEDGSMYMPEAMETKIQAPETCETQSGVTLDELIEAMVKNNREEERLAKERALEHEMQHTWDQNPHILNLRSQGKDAEAKEMLEAARAQLVINRGL